MKHKVLDTEYLTLCLDRLTRFKYTQDKYERVFLDICHKFEKNTLDIPCVKKIFNDSVKSYTDTPVNDFWNKLLEDDENKMFVQTKDCKKFFPLDLNIEGLLEIIENNENLPLNLKRLMTLRQNKDGDQKALRKKYSLLYPLEKIILTEGITEEILLEEFGRILGYDFKKEGVLVLGAGGKNQVAKKYYQMREEVNLPIFILLDLDAEETKSLIEPKLKKKDKIHLIKTGEFEDIIPYDIKINAVNNMFKNGYQISEKDFDKNIGTVKNLKEIYRINGFGDFQKADFAKAVKEILNKDTKITGELESVIKEIAQF